MQKEDLVPIVKLLKRLASSDEMHSKLERYCCEDLTAKERSEVDQLVEFVQKVLDEGFVSDRLRH